MVSQVQRGRRRWFGFCQTTAISILPEESNCPIVFLFSSKSITFPENLYNLVELLNL